MADRGAGTVMVTASIEGVMIRLSGPPQVFGLLILVLILPACKREDPKIRELTSKASQADEYVQELREVWRQQQSHFPLAGLTAIQPDRVTMELSSEQRNFLEERINSEVDSSRQSLLRDILNKDQTIKELKAHLAQIKAGLPEPEVAKSTDSHYGLAVQFLARQGIREPEARKLLVDVPLLARLAPGFEVYHFFCGGRYGTWVAQGQASTSPRLLNQKERDHLEGLRDEAGVRSRKLQQKRMELEAQKLKVEEEIASHMDERARLQQGYSKLLNENSGEETLLNSLHYLVGLREDLIRKGIVEIPIFSRSHAGRNWNDKLFTRSLDLRFEKSLLLRASDLGIKTIRKVVLVPGSFVQDQDYWVTVSADGQTAFVELLAVPRFKNEKVVFAVSE